MAFITKNRNQNGFIGYSINDFIPENHKARFIASIVDRLDLRKLYNDYSSQGGEAYDPSIMLAIWFFAYSEHISSTRKLEIRCRENLAFMYVSANLHPDHTSLSRFRKRHLHLIPDYFVQIIRIAKEEGISAFDEICIDGTKIPASASAKQNRKSESLSKEMAKIQEDIQKYLMECDMLSEEDHLENLEEIREKIAVLKNEEERLSELQRRLNERRSTIHKDYQERHTINKTEPEARSMKMSNGKASAPGYNGQLGVDVKSHIIVNADLNDAPNDSGQFLNQHKQVEENLGEDKDRKYTADSGYNSLDELEKIEKLKIDVIMPPEKVKADEGSKETKKYRKSEFHYDAEKDSYQCPNGKELTYIGSRKDGRKELRKYETSECGECPLREKCIRSKKPGAKRLVTRNEKAPISDRMQAKAKTEEGKQRLLNRKTSVEPVIGNLKSNMGFRRFTLRGLSNAKHEFQMQCIGHNLNKLFNHAIGLMRKAKSTLSLTISLLFFILSLLKQKNRPNCYDHTCIFA
jgi:transposase